MNDVLFFALGTAAVVGGWRVFRTESMARAAFYLLVSFLAVAGVLLLLGSDFLGGITVLMMTGEMVLMAVFMVMLMMNPGGLVSMSMGRGSRFPIVAAVVAFLVLTAGALTTDWPVRGDRAPADVTALIGEGMMEAKMLVFLAAGVALLACMVASLALALHGGRYTREVSR